MRTEPWFKITDEEIAAHIREGRTVKEIAKIADMHMQTIKNRIKRMDESGDMMRLIADGTAEESYIEFEDGSRFNRLDTIIHKKTKLRYRISHIYGAVVIVKRVVAEDYGRTNRFAPMMVNKDVLYSEYEKRDMGEVKCYIDENLIEKPDPSLAEKERIGAKEAYAAKKYSIERVRRKHR